LCSTAAIEPPGEHHCAECIEVGLTRHSGVQGYEASSRVEQQRQSTAAACEAEREARTKPLQPGTLKVVELAISAVAGSL
jgi:hypothetical protein